jgi:tRNA-2-methylthio-N6-dimethylallyladenosine synthase
LEKLELARQTIPDLAVSTDIIVGFPGETEEDFERTLEVTAAAEFDHAYTFIFSPRPGTEAAELVDDFCDPEEVKDRYKRLETVVHRSSLQKYQARVGKVEEVVVEGPSKKDPTQMTGRTAQNKLVHFESEPIKPGTYVEVEIVEAARQYLNGKYIKKTATPRYKTKIAVNAA